MRTIQDLFRDLSLSKQNHLKFIAGEIDDYPAGDWIGTDYKVGDKVINGYEIYCDLPLDKSGNIAIDDFQEFESKVNVFLEKEKSIDALQSKAFEFFDVMKRDLDYLGDLNGYDALHFVRYPDCIGFQSWDGSRKILGNSHVARNGGSLVGLFHPKNCDIFEVDGLLFFKSDGFYNVIAMPIEYKSCLFKDDKTNYILEGDIGFKDICDVCGSSFNDTSGSQICPDCNR